MQEDDEFVSCRDNCTWNEGNQCDFSLEIAFIANYPKHLVMKAILDHSMNNVYNKFYGENAIDITSPFAAGKAFN